MDKNKNLTDFLLLNGYSLKNVGFYNGKAGISLCLFEVSSYLQDEKIEEHAFELLQESLVLGERKKDITLSTGLSGIGFVLLYLIQNHFLDGDFEELFDEYLKIILSVLEQQQSYQSTFIRYIHFLVPLYKLNQDEKVDNCIKKILQETENYFEQQLNELTSDKSKLIKYQFLNDWIDYLKIVSKNNLSVPSGLIESYCRLFEKNKFAGNFEIACYLHRFLNEKYTGEVELLNRVIKENEKQALQNLQSAGQFLTLSERINLLYLLNQNPDKYKKQIHSLEAGFFNQPDNSLFQKTILKGIPRNKFIPGYEHGVARFLLYSVYRELKKEGKKVARFDVLF